MSVTTGIGGIKFIRVPNSDKTDPRDALDGVQLGDFNGMGDRKSEPTLYIKVTNLKGKGNKAPAPPQNEPTKPIQNRKVIINKKK
jgi:hypothetical protein